MAGSKSFDLLDERIQRFVWTEGWTELREAQELAIPLILPADRDVIISAATAAGKTEAAFLPALTRLLQNEPAAELILYVSPLKALINDQFGRLDKLCQHLEIPVWPWHGDISSSRKAKFFKEPKGVLLITPESVEAMLCNRGTGIASVFRRLSYIIVDELHAFIGSERGKQLQSLMHRIETAIGRSVPRVALSATLGDMRLAADFLRTGAGDNVALIVDKSGGGNLKVLVKGYESPIPKAPAENSQDGEDLLIVQKQIAEHLFRTMRGSNNLIFPNRRRDVEMYTHLLAECCEQSQVPIEFWPHHGSLSKDIREVTEAALKATDRPATAICTNTLELGIDIGAIKKVAQIGAPPTVASLRQRLGRSGRRKGEPAVLQGYCVEDSLVSDSNFLLRLRIGTVQMAAMVDLLIEGWFEPPATSSLHLSTLVQQLLSLIGQNGGSTASDAYRQLCASNAPFSCISAEDFKSLLRHLCNIELLMQDAAGIFLHGKKGEKHFNHYSFYAAFATEEEFRIVAGQKTLGSLPLSHLVRPQSRILFAGKTWEVDSVDEPTKTVFVTAARGGAPPLFISGGGRIHTVVRQRMRSILEDQRELLYLDSQAKQFVNEARSEFHRLLLSEVLSLNSGNQLVLLTWLGDSANEAIACFLSWKGFKANAFSLGVEVQSSGESNTSVLNALSQLADEVVPPAEVLLEDSRNLLREKWDWALPTHLLAKGYASQYLDVFEAMEWIRVVRSRLR